MAYHSDARPMTREELAKRDAAMAAGMQNAWPQDPMGAPRSPGALHDVMKRLEGVLKRESQMVGQATQLADYAFGSRPEPDNQVGSGSAIRDGSNALSMLHGLIEEIELAQNVMGAELVRLSKL